MMSCPACDASCHAAFWPVNSLVYLLNSSSSIRQSHLSTNVLGSFSYNIRYSVNVWVMDYIHHNSPMVWSPFNTILAILQLRAVSCSKGICDAFNLLSVYKAQVKIRCRQMKNTSKNSMPCVCVLKTKHLLTQQGHTSETMPHAGVMSGNFSSHHANQ